jgi:hypothetical protein
LLLKRLVLVVAAVVVDEIQEPTPLVGVLAVVVVRMTVMFLRRQKLVVLVLR